MVSIDKLNYPCCDLLYFLGIFNQFTLVVVSRELGSNELSRSVRVQVVGHVIFHSLHILAQLVERACGDEVASPVHLPRDGAHVQ